ncbi:unnamed protein product [Cylicocyclus nassatus]|uniref:Uncharacterized protein n=1 Tax=Cylicocyclus nassatus TaxID=53992 RepID=A0AA36ME75_CYLNA|nr:unnamed protein product [Cylicocyclus nassatus]
MNRAAGLLHGTRRLTAFAEVRAVHVPVPNEESVHREKHTSTGLVGKIMEQVNKIGNDRTHVLYGDYPGGNVGRPKGQEYEPHEKTRIGRGRGAVDELGDAECGGTGSRNMKDSSDYREEIKMSYRSIALLQSSRRLLACAEARNIHTAGPQYGVIKDAGDKAKEMAEAAKEKLDEAGKAVKDTVKAGYEKVADMGTNQTDKVHGKYPGGNVGRPRTAEAEAFPDTRRGRGKGTADELGDAESGGASTGKMKGTHAYRE